MQSRVQIKTDVGCYYVKEEHVNYYIAYAGDYYEHKITTECTEIIEKTDVKEIQTEQSDDEEWDVVMLHCLLCGEYIEKDETALWGHIQLEHEEKFMEVQDLETPDMLDECYE